MDEGRYTQFEGEHSPLTRYPKRVFGELLKQAEAERKDYIEFTPNQLREMSLKKEQRKKRSKARIT